MFIKDLLYVNGLLLIRHRDIIMTEPGISSTRELKKMHMHQRAGSLPLPPHIIHHQNMGKKQKSEHKEESRMKQSVNKNIHQFTVNPDVFNSGFAFSSYFHSLTR